MKRAAEEHAEEKRQREAMAALVAERQLEVTQEAKKKLEEERALRFLISPVSIY